MDFGIWIVLLWPVPCSLFPAFAGEGDVWLEALIRDNNVMESVHILLQHDRCHCRAERLCKGFDRYQKRDGCLSESLRKALPLRHLQRSRPDSLWSMRDTQYACRP